MESGAIMTNNLGDFFYRDGELFCETARVADIASSVGTPTYIYSKATLRKRYHAVREAFSEIDTTICFSVKCCGSLGVLATMHQEGSAFDVVSGGELFRVIRAGGDPEKIVYAGVGKSDDEIRFALKHNIMMFNVESENELANINKIADSLSVTAPVALRINPDVDAKTHAKTTTGKKENKFGIDIDTAGRIVANAADYPCIIFKGIDAHIGSPVNSTQPYAESADRLVDFVLKNRSKRTPFEFMNTGGGFGLLYNDEDVPSFKSYAEAIVPRAKKAGCKLIIEPGRSIAGNAAILLAKVQYRKVSGEKTFVIIDAGMHTLVRPAMYDSYHFIWPVVSAVAPAHQSFGGSEDALWPATDVVGPICESSDVFCKNRLLPPMKPGELVALFSAGAYGFTMSSQYNAHPRGAEVLVDGSSWNVIRERETWEDLVRGEVVPEL